MQMNNKIEYDTTENIKLLQSKLLRQTLRYANRFSPFYHNLFSRHEIKVKDILSVDCLELLPLTTKEDLLKYNKDFFCCHDCYADIVTTCVYTGVQPIIHPLSQCDLTGLAYNEFISFMEPPVTSSDYVMLAVALDGSFVAGLAYYMGIKRLGVSIVRAGSKNIHIQYKILKNFPITTIIGVPSNLIKLREYCLKEGMTNRLNSINKLILIGESIRNKDFTLNELGKRISACYPNANLFSTYANTETCVSFCECSAGKGGHLHPDLAYIEILDNENRRVKNGEIGRLVITTFGNQSMPLIRYDTGDVTFIADEPCECGRTSQRIGPILSRKKNIFKIGGVTFGQIQLENILLSHNSVIDYCVKIQYERDGLPTVSVWVSCKEENNNVAKQIRQKIWEELRIMVCVSSCSTEELVKIQQSTGSRKLVRYINLLNEV